MKLRKQIDRQSLAKYFLYGFIPAPATIFKGIKKPVVKDWQFDYSKKLKNWSRKQIKQEIVKLLKKAVEKYVTGRVPPGILLSGGIDSGLAAAMMTQFIPPEKIKAFSIGFKEKAFDESCYAKLTAKHLGIKHYLKIFSSRQAPDLINKIVSFLKEPMADPSILPAFLAFSLAKKKVNTVLLGDGGDEALAGYPKHLAHWFLKKTYLDKLPLSFLAGFFSGRLKNFLLYSSYPLYLRNQLWISHFSPQEVEELTGEKVSFNDLEKYHQLFNGQSFLDEAFFLDQKLTLADLYLVKTDRASKATSLKIGCPFLDKKLVQFCAQIPFEAKLKGFKTKSLLKEIALDYLPKEVVLRPKIGFGFPLTNWLDTNLKPLVLKELDPKKIKKEGILKSQAVKKALLRKNPSQIWNLLIFELWLKNNI